jgi:N-acetylneuraminate synthase
MSSKALEVLPISPEHKPFIIAEMSGNHNGSLARALEIVDAAASAGASALKIQTYTADTMTINVNLPGFIINDPTSLWNGRNLYDLYREASTPWSWHGAIFSRAKELGMFAFSSPFDESAVDFLDDLGVPAFKIASFENIDLPLIEKAARKGKPLIISTGLATLEEISDAVEAARAGGCPQIILLKTTSSYPASPVQTNLETIRELRKVFNCEVGLSDHTLGVGVAIASVGFGATVIEKHFTLDRKDKGVDSAFSLNPSELELLVRESESARLAIGDVHFGPTDGEINSLQFRRSLYVIADVRQGEEMTKENVGSIRPGFGLPPKFISDVLGKRAKKDLKRGTPMSMDFIND